MIKFCLDCRVSLKYRKKADELYIEYRDLKAIENFMTEEYKNTTLIVDTPPQITAEELDNIRNLRKTKPYILLALHDVSQATEEIRNDFLWYVMEPCNSFMEAKALYEHGAEYIVLGETLFFNIQRVKECGIENVRIMANQASHSRVPRVNGICGPWIRPEDLRLYDIFDLLIIEFPGVLPSKEEALYRIYAEQHKWPGPVEMIINGFNSPCENRMLPTRFTESRLNCRQRCHSCHICPNLVRLANRLIAEGEDIKMFLDKENKVE